MRSYLVALALRGRRTSRVVTKKPMTATCGITIVGVVYMLAAFVTTALAPIHAERLGKG